MYTAVILFVASVAVVSIAQKDDCRKLEHPHTILCCKKYSDGTMMKNMKMDDIRECFGPPNKPPPSCETEICIAKKRGYLAGEDGTADKSLFEAFMATVLEGDPDTLEAVKKECITDNIANYGSPNDCELIKLKMCVHKQMSTNCPEWDDKGPCKNIKDLVEKCKSE